MDTQIIALTLGTATAASLAIAGLAIWHITVDRLRLARVQLRLARAQRRLLDAQMFAAEQAMDIEAANDLNWADRIDALLAQMPAREDRP